MRAFTPAEAEKVLSILPIQAWKWPRPIVAVLMERSMGHAPSVFPNFMQLAAQGVPLMNIPYQRTDVARNHAAMELIRTEEYTHVIMLDVDHKHPADIIQHLCQWVMLDPEIKIVGGMNFKRVAPHSPCAFLINEAGDVAVPAEWGQGLLEVDAIGTGSILISREVFEQIEPPWFFNTYRPDDFWRDVWPGEDMGFSEKCREAGIKMYADTTLTSPHVTDRFIDEQDFRQAISSGEMQISETFTR